MTAAVSRRFRRLELQKAEVLQDLSSWPVAALARCPHAEAWSALHLLDHLQRVEHAFCAIVRQNLPAGRPIPFRDRCRTLIVACVMLSPIRVDVPSSAGFIVPSAPPPSFERVAANWERTRLRLRDLLTSLEPSHQRIGLFCHPSGGWTSIGGGLRFLSLHLHHHRYQLARLRKAAGNG